jgi:hypothetical protein
MKRSLPKKALIAVTVYLALWAATWLSAPRLLKRQLLKEVTADWQRYRADQEKKEEHYPHSNEPMAFAKGPQVDVELLSCPAPFLIEAKCGRIVGGLNGYGTVGRYLVTPWRVYILSEVHTWVS